ncbi:hypothetical protein LAZ67_8004055 [Cordylochernes scorpioides]|uniref:Ig-like domain-containing protein n=1 Tax=Cordylochernes scorpioides TaxID=51811 RepID=A0ABY6KX51_9ARAC|nr:hypothetical protein LAZ67_8004055 [Cordylochernes scorpioides]
MLYGRRSELGGCDVADVPQLSLRLGSKLRHSHIQEGNDVYFECNIRANPWVTEIGWKFEGAPLHTNVSAGIIVSNQTLVLQRVRRDNRGRYTCTGANSEGRGESAPLYLRVQFAPVCKPGQSTWYGAAKRETVLVTCHLDADPPAVNFSWTFNSSLDSPPLDIVTFSSEGAVSVATYVPRSVREFGSLLCSGRNAVGTQREPCHFTLAPAGRFSLYPEHPHNCLHTISSCCYITK